MDLLAAVIIACAITYAIKRGSEKAADGIRNWWSGVRARDANHTRGRASYEAARAGVRGGVTLAQGVGAGAAAGWREGRDRGKDWRHSRREALAGRDAAGRMSQQHRRRLGVQDACDPLWQRGRLHGQRGTVAADADKQPDAYRRGVEQGRRDKRRDLSFRDLTHDGWLDGLRGADAHRPKDTHYMDGYRKGQEAQDEPDPPRPSPSNPAPPGHGPAAPAAGTHQPTKGTNAMSQSGSADPQVVDLETAIRFARGLVNEAAHELEAAQAAGTAAKADAEEAQAAARRAQQHTKTLEVFQASLTQLGFGQALVSHVQRMVEQAGQRQTTAKAAAEAAEAKQAAAVKWTAAAEQQRTEAIALLRGLQSHQTVRDAASSAEGGMAHRQVYGAAAGQGGSR